MRKLFILFPILFGLISVAFAVEGSYVYTDVAVSSHTSYSVNVSSITPTMVFQSTITASRNDSNGNVISWFEVTFQTLNTTHSVYKFVPITLSEATPPQMTCANKTIIPAAQDSEHPAEVTERISQMKAYMLSCNISSATLPFIITLRGR